MADRTGTEIESLASLGAVRDLLDRHGLRLNKSLGQNFLVNPGICPKMAAASGAAEGGVLEIGPGVGVLTRELSKLSKKVVAIELDRRLFPVLEETLAGRDNVELCHGDALKLDLKALIEEKFTRVGIDRVCVCANLPYYITSPLIMAMLEGGLPISSITVMVQKEAAERFCAPPGVRACGAVSVGVHYRSVPKILFSVSRGSFLPPPNVDSAVIRFDILSRPPVSVQKEEALFLVAKGAFSKRRKTAVNALSASLGLEKSAVEEALVKAGAKITARAEELSLRQFAILSDALFPGGKNG